MHRQQQQQQPPPARYGSHPFILDPKSLTIGAKISEGGGGAVFKGAYCGQQVAVKKVFSQTSDLEEFARECNFLSKMGSCPFIIRFYGVTMLMGGGGATTIAGNGHAMVAGGGTLVIVEELCVCSLKDVLVMEGGVALLDEKGAGGAGGAGEGEEEECDDDGRRETAGAAISKKMENPATTTNTASDSEAASASASASASGGQTDGDMQPPPPQSSPPVLPVPMPGPSVPGNFRFSKGAWWTMSLQIAKGVQHCHCQSVAHCDLKPQNVVLDRHGAAKLCDFGIAKEVTKATMTYIGGTCDYMAPEMIDCRFGKATAGLKVDVYAFGLILWTFAARKMPWRDQKHMGRREFEDYIMAGNRPTVPSDTPAAIRSLIGQCWAHEAAERPSFDEIVDELGRFISEL